MYLQMQGMEKTPISFLMSGRFLSRLLSFDDRRSTSQLSHAIASGAEARDP
jgi:hypothetical protein